MFNKGKFKPGTKSGGNDLSGGLLLASQDYVNGYEAGSKHGYRQGYKEGLEAGIKAGREEVIKAIAEVPGIPDATRFALYKMGKKAHPHQNNEPDNVRSVFADCPCLNCIDGGVDMPYCGECNRANGYAYFRKKVVITDG